MGKYANTLKMMGTDSKQAFLFEDAMECIHLTINPTVRQKHQETILGTIVMGKTLRQHHTDIVKQANRKKLRDVFGKIIKYDDVITKDFGRNETIILIEILLEQYYQKIW